MPVDKCMLAGTRAPSSGVTQAPSTDRAIVATSAPKLEAASILADLALHLSACDPSLLTSGQRRSLLVQLQSVQAQVAALEGQVLVAECGPKPRKREVRVTDSAGFLADTRALERQHGGEVHVVAASGDAAGEAPAPTVVIVDEVVDELAAMLHRSSGSMRHALRRARTLHRPLAAIRAALEAGTISSRHANVICDQAHRMQVAPLGEHAELDEAFLHKCAALARQILPIAVTATPGRTESQAQRLVTRIDAIAEHERRARAKQQMDVTARPSTDGLANIMATMSAIDAARLIGRVDTLARDAIATGAPLLTDPHATIGQQRIAALLHLVGLSTVHCSSGRASAPQTDARHRDADHRAVNGPAANGPAANGPAATVFDPQRSPAPSRSGRVEVQVLVDARVLVGNEPDAAGWVRTGADFAPVSRDDIVELLADSTVPTVLRRLLVDPITGALVDRGATSYVPSEALVAWLRTRDLHCRFPGCTARADRCDVDHATDFVAGGQTTVANTGLLCRRHHNIKTHGSWHIIESTADGSCTFVSPTGVHYVHEPINLASLMAGTPGQRSPRPAMPWPGDDPPAGEDPPF